MRTDCQTCPVREVHCADCMVPVLLAMQAPEPFLPHRPRLDARERGRLEMLAALGLVDACDIDAAVVETSAGLRTVG